MSSNKFPKNIGCSTQKEEGHPQVGLQRRQKVAELAQKANRQQHTGHRRGQHVQGQRRSVALCESKSSGLDYIQRIRHLWSI